MNRPAYAGCNPRTRSRRNPVDPGGATLSTDNPSGLTGWPLTGPYLPSALLTFISRTPRRVKLLNTRVSPSLPWNCWKGRLFAKSLPVEPPFGSGGVGAGLAPPRAPQGVPLQETPQPRLIPSTSPAPQWARWPTCQPSKHGVKTWTHALISSALAPCSTRWPPPAGIPENTTAVIFHAILAAKPAPPLEESANCSDDEGHSRAGDSD